jgi:hypothetical protein
MEARSDKVLEKKEDRSNVGPDAGTADWRDFGIKLLPGPSSEETN